MSLKTLVGLSILIGSTIGGSVPTIWGAPTLSFSSILGSVIGGLLGIWVAYKIDDHST